MARSGLYDDKTRYPWKVEFEVFVPIARVWVKDEVHYTDRDSAGRGYIVRKTNTDRYRNPRMVLK